MIYVTTGGFSNKNGAQVTRDYLHSGIIHIELSAGKYSKNIEEKLQVFTNECSFILHNYFPVPEEPFVLNLASLNDTVFTKSYEHIHSAIGMASRLGSGYYSFHAGFLLDPKPNELGKQIRKQSFFDRDQCIERFVYATNNLAEYASAINVRLLIENNVCSPRNFNYFNADPFLLSAPEGINEIFQCLNPEIKMLLDVAHLKVSANTLKYNTDEFVSECFDLIGGYHLSDNCGTVDSNEAFSKESYFWEYIKKGLDYYSIEVYNVNNKQLIELSNLVSEKLS